MKRKLRFLAGACLFTATALFSGCSSDDDFLMDPVDSGTSQTRAVTNSDGTLTITFDDFDLVSGRYVIDAKSIMGIFSLDLSKPIDLNVHADGDALQTVLDVLAPYIV